MYIVGENKHLFQSQNDMRAHDESSSRALGKRIVLWHLCSILSLGWPQHQLIFRKFEHDHFLARNLCFDMKKVWGKHLSYDKIFAKRG